MYTSILVALDGSELAELVLPYVEAIAEKFDSVVVLVRAISSVEEILSRSSLAATSVTVPVTDPIPLIDAEREESLEYLDGVAERLRARGTTVVCQAPEGPAGDMILQESRSRQVELIAMTTHGRSGLGRLVFGSVAEHVLRQAPCPVLLVRVSKDRKPG